MTLPIHHLLPGPKLFPPQLLPGGLGLGLARGRVHEVCGSARCVFAAFVMNQSQGPVMWALPGWQPERINPQGFSNYADTGRIIFAAVRRADDLLWITEEALRSGATPLVVAELLEPPALTPIRRLHLAAETGSEAALRRGELPPLALLLTPGSGGAPGVESRWRMQPRPSAPTRSEYSMAWEITRLRARTEPPARWHAAQDGKGPIELTPLPTEV